jgi:hypothetical protein
MKKSEELSVDAYLENLPQDRLEAIQKLRTVFKKHLPKGFEEEMSYGMIGYVVPHSIFPAGYHCNPKLPLPFITMASQKQFIAIYHMGMYMDKTLLDWFVEEHAKACPIKLDMGKSCIRYKKPDQIPFDLIGELATKMSTEQWINCYNSQLKKK